jgi:mycothiol synthase
MLKERTIKTTSGEFATRPAEMADVENVATLLNTTAIEQTGEPEWDLNELRNDWSSPHFDLVKDSLLVLSADGEIVGYADVWDQEPHVRLFCLARVLPGYRGRGVGTLLTRWLDRRGQEAVRMAPEGTRVVLLQAMPSTDTLAQEHIKAHGYTLVRFFNQMIIEMKAPPPNPIMPKNIVIRPYRRGREEEAVLQVVREAFKDHWGYVENSLENDLKAWMHWIENDPDHDPSLWFLATVDDQLIGASVCSPKAASDPEMGWINSLAVLRSWRRQGIGLALLRHTFVEFYRRGVYKVGLGVDAQNLTGATSLYERAGMTVQRRYADYEKELRPGEDLSTQTVQG